MSTSGYDFRKGLFEGTEEGVAEDLLTIAQMASSKHPGPNSRRLAQKPGGGDSGPGVAAQFEAPEICKDARQGAWF